MKALILAAGQGSRLKELTQERPKGMVEFCGCSLVERAVNVLRLCGVSQIGIVTGYRSEAFSFLDLETFKNEDWQTTNMVRSLMAADKWLANDDCIISYSDIFYSPVWVKKLINSDVDIAITYDTEWHDLWRRRFENPLDDAETFKIDDLGFVSEIGQHTENVQDIQGQYMGLFKLKRLGWMQVRKIIDSLSKHELDSISITEVLQLLITNDIQVKGIPVCGQWGEIDHPSDLTLSQNLQQAGFYEDWLDFKSAK